MPTALCKCVLLSRTHYKNSVSGERPLFRATIFKFALGIWLALLLNRHFCFKRIIRVSLLLPFIIPKELE